MYKHLISETRLKKIITESIGKILEGDYDANYEELMRREMHNLAELETKVPVCYRENIHNMVVEIQSLLEQIQRNRDFEDWNH